MIKEQIEYLRKNLLVDLSSRLIYGVIVKTPKGDGRLCGINQTIFGDELLVNVDATKRDTFKLEDCKPYLRSMSSMTEDELREYEELCFIYDTSDGTVLFGKNGLDWLNAHHFDYRGLIEEGLAIEVTKENNPYERNN